MLMQTDRAAREYIRSIEKASYQDGTRTQLEDGSRVEIIRFDWRKPGRWWKWLNARTVTFPIQLDRDNHWICMIRRRVIPVQ